MDLDIEGYAALMAELAAAGDGRAAAAGGRSPDAAAAAGGRSHDASRAEVLERHGLDEASWEVLDTHWQDRLSEAVDVEDDGVPEILSRYAAAYEAAQRSFGELISIAQFARVTRILGATGDLRAALARTGVKLADFLRGSEHWSRRIAEEPDVEREFEEALRGG